MSETGKAEIYGSSSNVKVKEKKELETTDVYPQDKDSISKHKMIKVVRRKCIVNSLRNDKIKRFSGICPPIVIVDGVEYLNKGAYVYKEFGGNIGQVVNLNQYEYNCLKGAGRPTPIEKVHENGTKYTETIKIKNYAIEDVE
jgi:hypothetical protein